MLIYLIANISRYVFEKQVLPSTQEIFFPQIQHASRPQYSSEWIFRHFFIFHMTRAILICSHSTDVTSAVKSTIDWTRFRFSELYNRLYNRSSAAQNQHAEGHFHTHLGYGLIELFIHLGLFFFEHELHGNITDHLRWINQSSGVPTHVGAFIKTRGQYL